MQLPPYSLSNVSEVTQQYTFVSFSYRRIQWLSIRHCVNEIFKMISIQLDTRPHRIDHIRLFFFLAFPNQFVVFVKNFIIIVATVYQRSVLSIDLKTSSTAGLRVIVATSAFPADRLLF